MARRAIGFLVLLVGLSGSLAGQLRMITVPVSGPAGLDSLARLGFEVSDLRRTPSGLEAYVVASPETERLLAARGFAAAPVPGAPPAGAAADSFTVFRSFDKPLTGIRATLTAWAAADTLIHVDSIGASIEGRPILAVKIGDPNDDPARPNVLFLATHHAREWVSTEMAMQLIRWLADSLSVSLLAARDIWVIPVENPDGYQFTFTTDRLWRKNRRPNGDGSFGVDPNRNYPAFWGLDDLGSSGLPISEIYRGTAPASEPETQAIVAFHAAHPPVVSVSYHTYGGMLLYPYGFRAGAFSPDLPVFRALTGTEQNSAVRDSVPASLQDRYHPGPGWILYTTNGEYTDWAYRAHGSIAITPELTSGCCTPDSGFYYGFVFPDDSTLVRRVFRDNLPFALAVITAAAAPALATGPTGTVPTPVRVESIWPETWVSLPASGPMPFGLSIRTRTGAVTTRSLSTDSLARGVVRWVWRSDVSVDGARAVRVDGIGLEAELISVAGAEDTDLAWTGWTRSNDALVGAWSWATITTDTLTSPAFDLTGRTHLWLHFWTKYRGSTFSPQFHGLVQASRDSGVTWSNVLDLVGDGPAWYPLRVDVPQLEGARAARIRFVSESYPWWVDAVGIASDSTVALDSLAAPAALEVSENPVRSALVWVSWPAGTGAPRLGIYTFAGARLVEAALAPGTTEYAWDLTAGGRTVTNGAYLVVLELDGHVLRRRLFVTR
ncbi:MAG TPA: M14 family metallopeptidase [Gemmatimonadales bacterium]|nr:M14 family metallopeptidase [Gemmatimonadales bacterium]